MIICGLWGLISLSNLVLNIFSKENKWPGLPLQWFGVTLGIGACIIGLFTMAETKIMIFVFIGPVIAAAHLLYLSKNSV